VIDLVRRVEVAEADFCTLCPERTFLRSTKPVRHVH
jgi:hypothetical protein